MLCSLATESEPPAGCGGLCAGQRGHNSSHLSVGPVKREGNDQPAKGTRYRAPGRDSKAIVLEERQEVTEGDRA